MAAFFCRSISLDTFLQTQKHSGRTGGNILVEYVCYSFFLIKNFIVPFVPSAEQGEVYRGISNTFNKKIYAQKFISHFPLAPAHCMAQSCVAKSNDAALAIDPARLPYFPPRAATTQRREHSANSLAGRKFCARLDPIN